MIFVYYTLSYDNLIIHIQLLFFCRRALAHRIFRDHFSISILSAVLASCVARQCIDCSQGISFAAAVTGSIDTHRHPRTSSVSGRTGLHNRACYSLAGNQSYVAFHDLKSITPECWKSLVCHALGRVDKRSTRPDGSEMGDD